MSDEPFEAEVRLVNEEGFHKTILEKTTFADDSELINLVKAFDEGRKFAIGVQSGGVSASKAFEQGVFLGQQHTVSPQKSRGFLLGYQNPTGKLEVVK